MGAAGGQKEAASAANHSQSRFSIRTGGQTRAEQVIVRGALIAFLYAHELSRVQSVMPISFPLS
jgi:hypothetical protein